MSYTMELTHFNKEHYTPKPGMSILCDYWPTFQNLIEASDFDREWSNEPNVLRLETGYEKPLITDLSVLVDISGYKAHSCDPMHQYKVRVKVTFVHDGEPNTHTYGWMYFWTN